MPTYRNNPFHNFEHASHVTMSVVKLLSRIVAPDLDQGRRTEIEHPLTQFACVYAALIHDVEPTGVPNTRLVLLEGEDYTDVQSVVDLFLDLRDRSLQHSCNLGQRGKCRKYLAIYTQQKQQRGNQPTISNCFDLEDTTWLGNLIK